ncbi:hypothetical protein AMATHDRAFT_145587 [Amanita thiersii Skay4041]|uniref:AAA+ ATPase domain-containing protein n=1 Tax=Amanita thiersii Skay4041 TaxID=703135 RepID=A0A2A9NPL1_9AGAR|nr:hypothetical protein AMATHDRAFT_145587 [Amanita thiersii Skay4041]
MNASPSNHSSDNATAEHQQRPPAQVSPLVALLSSLSDWLGLIMVGGLIEMCRRLVFSLYNNAMETCFITATFYDRDRSYDWIVHWLSMHPAWSRSRNLEVATTSYKPDGATRNDRKPDYLPATSTSLTIWYKCRWMRVTRTERDIQTNYSTERELSITITILAGTHKILDDLLLEAKTEYLAAEEDNISIYMSDTSNCWKHISDRPKRSLTSIILDPGVKDSLLADAKDFLESKAWYNARGIPFRRGYLLYGAPGSGKTSIIHSLAGALDLDIYIISLSRAGLDDNSLSKLITELPEHCIAIIEDIDAALTQTLNRDADDDDDNCQGFPVGRITLSGLLNALDGIGAQEGRLLFATTNKYLALDPALCRPGRMDVHIEFKLASKYQASELYKSFYMCEQDDTAPEEPKDTDSGYASEEDEKTRPLIDFMDTVSEVSVSSTIDSDASITGTLHQGRAPKLSRRTVIALAEAFAEAIPERELSMAALQGHLMMFKTRPLEAVRDAKSWVEKQRQERMIREAMLKE